MRVYDGRVHPNEVRFELRDFLETLRRRQKFIFFTMVAVLLVALAASQLQSPVYSARAELVIEDVGAKSAGRAENDAPRDPIRRVQTEISVLRSQPVRAAVREQLGTAPRFSAEPVEDSDLIRVTAEDRDPKRAADIANAYANAYVNFRRQQDVEDAAAASRAAQAKIADLQAQISRTTGQDREVLSQQQALFRERLAELQVGSALTTGAVRLVPAFPPASPTRPEPAQTAAIATVLGLILGLGGALVVEYLDDSLRTKEDLEQAVPGTTVMSLVPRDPVWKNQSEARLSVLREPMSPVAEAFRTLRTSIQVLGLGSPVKTLQITSPNPGDGKSTTLANLATAMAQTGGRIAIIGCDLRRPRIHEFFGVSNDVGLTSVLVGEATAEEAATIVPGVDRILLLPSGPPVENPSELLSSRQFNEILEWLESVSTTVLIDSPPLLPVSDALVLASKVDGTLLVCQSGKTRRRDAARAAELMAQVESSLMGSILNSVSPQGTYGGYGYEYQSNTPVGTNGRDGSVDPTPWKGRLGLRKGQAAHTKGARLSRMGRGR